MLCVQHLFSLVMLFRSHGVDSHALFHRPFSDLPDGEQESHVLMGCVEVHS